MFYRRYNFALPEGFKSQWLKCQTKYSLWSLDVDEIDLVTCRYFLHSFVVQEYEFQSMFYFDDKYPVFNQYTNDPSYFTGLLSSTMTMSIAGGQTNQYLTNPSYLAGLLSSTMTMSIAGGHTNQHKNQANTISASDYNPAEESCTEEFSNLNYHHREDIANASDVLYPMYQRDTYLSAT